MSEAMRNIPAPSAFDLASRIEAQGYAVIEDFVPADELGEAQDFVRQSVARNGGEYIAFAGHENLGGTFLERLPTSSSFIDLCRGIYEEGTNAPPPEVKFHQILRCLSGAQARQHSMRFHYDSYVLTALIPILMPSHGSKGNLIIMPNSRSIRKSYAGNVCDKILVDNRLSQALLGYAYRHHLGRMISLDLKPGNLYFFWGYRTLHTNEPCDADEIRSTALWHYADPHADSYIKRIMRKPGSNRNANTSTLSG